MGTTKICGRCRQEKLIVEFHKDSSKKDGLCYDCKECRGKANKISQSKRLKAIYENTKKWRNLNPEKYLESKRKSDRKYYKKNKTHIKQKMAEYRLDYPDKTKSCLERSRKKWLENNLHYRFEKYHNDINFRLRVNLRNRLGSVLKKQSKQGSAVRDLGCAISELKKHLEQQFQPGMTWDNYGKYGWHIDHIKPLCSFNLTNREELLQACHYTNLQPLWAKDNLKKGGRV